MNQWTSRVGLTALALAASACGSSGTSDVSGTGGAAATTTVTTGAGGAGTTTVGVGGNTSTSTGTLATGSTGSGASQPPAQQLYGSAIHNLVFEIDYAPSAEPYTGAVLGFVKPVIASTSSGAPGLNVERYVEQATIVHEFGHAAGLVDNGLAQASPPNDAAHDGHCTNQDCVMYWAIEGTGGAIAYVQKSLLSSNTVLWGKECLDDAAKATTP